MEKYLYEAVDTKDVVITNARERNNKSSWMPLLRQIFICSGVCNGYFIIGVYTGVPAVLAPQLRKEANSTEAVSEEEVSWMSSVGILAALPCYVLPLISGRVGRKYPFIGISIMCLIASLVFYFGTNVKSFIIARILLGPMQVCVVTISVVILVEYSSPKNRGVFLLLKSASYNWGVWVSNALGTFFHWRCIAVLCIICSLYNALTSLFWCESPPWLAYIGKYEECEKSHRWIKGDSDESYKDLETLISSCKAYSEKQAHEKIYQKKFLLRTLKTVRDKTFYMPLLLCIAVLALYLTSGKMVCIVYVIQIIKNITSSESTAFKSMLILDGVAVACLYICTILAKYLKRRTMLLTGSVGGVAFLFTLSLYLYLCKRKYLEQNTYVTLTLLSLFYLFITLGPIILSYALYGELMPLRYRTPGMLITGIFISSLNFTSLKTAPYMFRIFDMHGFFLIYGLVSVCIILFLFKYLPETKDKTSQEIEDFFITKKNKEEPAALQSLTGTISLKT